MGHISPIYIKPADVTDFMPRPKPPFKKVAVFGAGLMGRGIAAILANQGIEVLLLDLPENGERRSKTAEDAIEKLRRATPQKDILNANLTLDTNADLITAGNSEDDLHKLAECDAVFEAITENVDWKRDLFRKLGAACRPGTPIYSNTSTIRLKTMLKGLPRQLREDVSTAHFFSPTLHTDLLEITKTPTTNPAHIEKIRELGEIHLGKEVILCPDTPGLQGNRIGTYHALRVIRETLDTGMSIPDADAIMGKPMGALQGVFQMLDMVGIGLTPSIVRSLHKALPDSDPFRALPESIPFIDAMIKKGNTGRSSISEIGFYRVKKIPGKLDPELDGNGKKILRAVDPATGEYRDVNKTRYPSLEAGRRGGARAVFEGTDEAARFAWSAMSDTLVYALNVCRGIGKNPAEIDAAMEKGFNWKRGPFRFIDALGDDDIKGTTWLIDRLRAEGREVPEVLLNAAGKDFYRVEGKKRQELDFNGRYHNVKSKPGVFDFEDFKIRNRPIMPSAGASVWDVGGGTLCLELHPMADAIDTDVLRMIQKAVDLLEQDERYSSMVIYNAGKNFSVGANLGLAARMIAQGKWERVYNELELGQDTMLRLKYAKKPVVAAVTGYTFGGGAEIAKHCAGVQAWIRSVMGLVESGVGFLPGWGGTTALFLDHLRSTAWKRGPVQGAIETYYQLLTGKIAASAQQAQKYLLVGKDSGITPNRAHLFTDALARARAMAPGYTPPEPIRLPVLGDNVQETLRWAISNFHANGLNTNTTFYDVCVGDAMGRVLTGAGHPARTYIEERDFHALERISFIMLAAGAYDMNPRGKWATQLRLYGMLTNRKPFRETALPGDRPTARSLYDGAQPVALDGQLRAAAADVRAFETIDRIRAHVEGGKRVKEVCPDHLGLSEKVFKRAAQETWDRLYYKDLPRMAITAMVTQDPAQVVQSADFFLREKIRTTRQKFWEAANDDTQRRSELAGRLAIYERYQTELRTLTNG